MSTAYYTYIPQKPKANQRRRSGHIHFAFGENRKKSPDDKLPTKIAMKY